MHIKVENLHKTLGKNKVLDGLSLEIPQGELCVIVGASGTGKSVFLKHLVGLMKPDEGRILIDGEDIVPMPERDLLEVRRRFGMIFQSGGLLQSLSLGDNVGLSLREVHRKKGSDVSTVVAEKLEAVGLGGREDQKPSTLSGGQIKRAAMARALTTGAECLLFDEPTAGLDPLMAKTIDEVISEVNANTGATAVVVTHDLISVFKMADCLHFLDRGRAIYSGSVDAFRNSEDERVRAFLDRDMHGRESLRPSTQSGVQRQIGN